MKVERITDFLFAIFIIYKGYVCQDTCIKYDPSHCHSFVFFL
jgi:hypothetical protein